jgi:sialate O-acetylesterase
MNKTYLYIFALKLFLIALLFNTSLFAQDYQKVVDLNERWKFSIGDEKEWAYPDFDDSDWERINVPSSWENQGFHGYDGYAWYRIKFEKPENLTGQTLYLNLGNIDDVDEVFLNGFKIGKTGNFPPKFETAYQANRFYNIPTQYLRQSNTLAVRVYDDIGEGGILRGDISIVIDKGAIPLDVDLQGTWKFKTGKNAHKDVDNMDSWDDIIVPGLWENQGYKNYDGYACYAQEFVVDADYLSDRMVLILGYIDDLDQVFVNGVLVGQSGAFKPSTVSERSESYKQLRAYYLPVNVLKKGEKNRIVVKVYDAGYGGGIYSGYIGLISQKNYIKYWNNRRER